MDTRQLEIDLLESVTMTEIDLDEHFAEGLALREAKVDRDEGVIRNMTIMNRTSLNGHRYSDLGLEDAVKKFNGARFYIDHPTKSEMRDRNGTRSIRDLAGKVINTRKVGDSVRADIQLLNLKGMRAMVFALAEQMPELAGNSIRATGIGRKDATGQFVVDGFKEATSVDLVTMPAGTRGFFESHSTQKDDEHMDLATLKSDHKDLIEALRTEFKADATNGAELKKLQDENTKMKKNLDESKAREALRERKDLVTKKLEDAKLPKAVVTDLFIKQLEDAENEKAIDALIQDRKGLAKSVKSGPRSTEREVVDSTGGGEYKEIEESKLGEYAEALGVR